MVSDPIRARRNGQGAGVIRESDLDGAQRRAAGREAGPAPIGYAARHPVVLALPRSGVPVAFEVARHLDTPLDLIFVQQIAARLTIRNMALAPSSTRSDPQLVIITLDPGVGHPPRLHRGPGQSRKLRGDRLAAARSMSATASALPIHSRLVILVDDGIATGGTGPARRLQGLAQGRHRRHNPGCARGSRRIRSMHLRQRSGRNHCLADARAPSSAVGLQG